MSEVSFLFDNQLIAEVENLIRNAKHKLLLVSPYIDLDSRLIAALNEKKNLHDFQLLVLFGKNERNYKRSIRKDSLELFMEFPNVEIRYNERLHAKFYQNDAEFIMTSLNLYDYSLANNIEAGIKMQYSSKGLFWKAMDVPLGLIDDGVDKVKENVLGMTKELNPIEKFKTIFESSELKYKTEPTIVEKDGIRGMIGGKKLGGFAVVQNSFTTSDAQIQTKPEPVSTQKSPQTQSAKLLSVSQLSKITGQSTKDLAAFMQNKGLINGDHITDNGKSKGLQIKNYMGKDYIVYPENLPDLRDLVN